jgi:hypothetical protein
MWEEQGVAVGKSVAGEPGLVNIGVWGTLFLREIHDHEHEIADDDSDCLRDS